MARPRAPHRSQSPVDRSAHTLPTLYRQGRGRFYNQTTSRRVERLARPAQLLPATAAAGADDTLDAPDHLPVAVPAVGQGVTGDGGLNHDAPPGPGFELGYSRRVSAPRRYTVAGGEPGSGKV